MEIHLKIVGIMMIGLAIIHLIFPKYFDWKKDFSSVSLINKQMMYVHTFFIALIVLLMGILCLTESNELVESAFGKKIAGGLFIFWFCRLMIQLFGYSSKLWKGKPFETTIHILFSLLWIYFCSVFFMTFWR